MPAPEENADRVLAKCGRRCCLCRRFRPIRLQVHHIVPRGEGGTDDEDNLIALCLTCHTDVHTKAPFTRRFTVEELKMHRDEVCRLVADGKLPATEYDDDEIIRSVLEHLAPSASNYDPAPKLSRKATAILLAAAHSQHGFVTVFEGMGPYSVTAGTTEFVERENPRSAAECKHALNELCTNGLLEHSGDETLLVSHLGYLTADQLLTAGFESSHPPL